MPPTAAYGCWLSQDAVSADVLVQSHGCASVHTTEAVGRNMLKAQTEGQWVAGTPQYPEITDLINLKIFQNRSSFNLYNYSGEGWAVGNLGSTAEVAFLLTLSQTDQATIT